MLSDWTCQVIAKSTPYPMFCFNRKPRLLNRHRLGLLFWDKPKAAFWVPFQCALVLTLSLDSVNRSLSVMKDNYSNKTNLFNNLFIKILEKLTGLGLNMKTGPGLLQLEFIVKYNINFFKPRRNKFCRERTQSETGWKKKRSQAFLDFLLCLKFFAQL